MFKWRKGQDSDAGEPVTQIDGSNPYLLAESVWAVRFGSFETLAVTARIMTVIGCCALMANLAAYMAVKSRQGFVPFLTSTPELLPQRALTGTSIARLPDGVVRRELATFIERLRSIPADRVVLRRDVSRLFTFLANTTSAERKVKEYMEDKQQTPQAFLGRLTRTVDVTSVVFRGGDSWLVEWRETVQPLVGGEATSGLYQATLTIGEAEPQDPDALAVNPFGLFVRDYTISYLGAD